ncbi:MAG TPA: hypothetical protein VFY25_06895, partial [Anaerolineales bacterium]|nr:hypothetical protein [Anaerolineales bacterium]
KFGDMVVYNSFGEWKASPYAANPADGAYRTCQDCHMSNLHERTPEAPSWQRQACAASAPLFQNFNHNMMNVGEDEIPYMVKNAAEIRIEIAKQTGKNTLDFTVNVTNTKAGHKFPTDSPLRHLILVVDARDRSGTPLILVGGDRIPNWAGPGPSTSRAYALDLENRGVKDYGGLPGEIFANLLVEEETNLSPGMAYWNETKLASSNSDTRLWPFTPDPSFYSFAMPDAGDVTINVKLMYRFAFFDLMAWQEWLDQPDFERADILVSEWQCEGSPRQSEALQQSCKRIGP